MDGCTQYAGYWFPQTETHMQSFLAATQKFAEGELARNSYQIHTLKAFVQAVPEDKRGLVLDVGGHVGTWSTKLARLFKEVVAFEPIQIHAKCFRENAKSFANVRLWECGLADKADVVEFVRCLDNSGATHVKGSDERTGGTSLEQALVMPLDAFNYRPAAIKIDVEGFEKWVLMGGEQTIRETKPVICLEQKAHGYYGDGQYEAIALLQKWGARIVAEVNNDFVIRWVS
jgi:FkbM family methyltransferase